jgi:transposase-like protein
MGMNTSNETPTPLVKEEAPASRGSVPLSRKVYRKFTKEFKEAVIRRVEGGTPLKRVARAENLDPAMVRAWRDELRDLGPGAFSRTEGRRFTKEMKEAAVKRVEEGTPVKEMARACRVDPTEVRRWRTVWRTLGPGAFDAAKKPRPKAEPKPRLVIFRITEDEHGQLKSMAKAAGARSLADFARRRLLEATTRPLCPQDETSNVMDARAGQGQQPRIRPVYYIHENARAARTEAEGILDNTASREAPRTATLASRKMAASGKSFQPRVLGVSPPLVDSTRQLLRSTFVGQEGDV